MKRRRLVLSAFACASLITAAIAWYGQCAAEARAIMLEAFEHVHERIHDLDRAVTEQDVTALIGASPIEGASEEMTVRKKGGRGQGGRYGNAQQLKKWRRYGTEMDVWFAEDGAARGVYVSNPPPLHDTVIEWLRLIRRKLGLTKPRQLVLLVS